MSDTEWINEFHRLNPDCYSQLRKHDRQNNWKPHLVVGLSRDQVSIALTKQNNKETRFYNRVLVMSEWISVKNETNS